MARYRYKAFISYAHADRRRATWLHEALESYRPPRRLSDASLRPIFRDRDEFSASGDLSAAVDAGLSDSEFLIVVCSPAAAASRWVNEEVLRFKALRGEAHILPLIVAGAPFSDDPATECFPNALRHHVDADGTIDEADFEPLAADLAADGRRRAFLKIAAALLRVPFDALVQRDLARQVRRWALATSLTAAGLVVAVGLAAFAWLARGEARAQRAVADDQRAEAVAQRAEAEGLIEFMLTDLRAKLQPVGLLDALADVGERAQAYYRRLPPGQQDESSLARSARALDLIGEIDNLRGDLDDAVVVFAQSHVTTAELLARDPDNPDRIYGHAQSAYWLGYVDWQRGRGDSAMRAFREYETLARRLVTIDPARDEWQAELGYAESNLGTLLLESGRFQAAEHDFRASLDVFQGLAERTPDDVEWQLEVGQSYAWLTDALREQLRFAEAIDMRLREIAIYAPLRTALPGDRRLDVRWVAAHRALGTLRLLTGEVPAARMALDEALSVARSLLAFDADNTLWMDITVGALLDRAALDQETGGGDPAAAVREALAMSRRLVALDPDVLMWHVDGLERARLLQSTLLAPEAARAQLDDVIHVLSGYARINPQRAIQRLAQAHAERARRFSATAAADWQRVDELIGPLERPTLTARVLRLEALVHTGRADEAGAPLAELEQAGYRAPRLTRLLAGG